MSVPVVLAASSLHQSAALGAQGGEGGMHSGITAQGFALVCCDFVFYGSGHVGLN